MSTGNNFFVLYSVLKHFPQLDYLMQLQLLVHRCKTIHIDAMAIEALDTLESNNISQILVVDLCSDHGLSTHVA